MGGKFSSAARDESGLYTVSVLQGDKAVTLKSKYIRFDTSGGTLPQEEFKMDGRQPKPEEVIPKMAKMVRSQMLLMMYFEAVLETEDSSNRAVRAVYVPVDKIKVSKKGEEINRSKTVLALLRSLFMSENDVYNRLVQVSNNDPKRFEKDSEVLDLITSALYIPEFRLPYDVPNGVQNGVTGDNRDLLRAAYSPPEIPSKPVIPSSFASVNPLYILLAIIALVAILYFVLRT